jgi:hypothetical protein
MSPFIPPSHDTRQTHPTSTSHTHCVSTVPNYPVLTTNGRPDVERRPVGTCLAYHSCVSANLVPQTNELPVQAWVEMAQIHAHYSLVLSDATSMCTIRI